MSGWIKLHRKITEWEWYSDHNVFILFMHLLLTVNHEDKRWRGVDVKRGQIITGRLKLAEETGLSEKEIRTALTKLKSTGEVAMETASKYSIITICNFNEYQSAEKTEGPAKGPEEGPQKGPARGQQGATTKEVKKLKKTTHAQNAQTDPRFEEFWESYPRKADKKKAYASWQKKGCGNGVFETIMKKLEQFKTSDSWSRDEGRYIPYPTTWINGERWNDEIECKIGNGKKIGGYTF